MSMSQNGGGTVAKGNDTAYNLISTTQTTVTTSPTQVVDVNPFRSKLCLFNTSTDTPIFVSSSTSVATTDGFGLEPQRHIVWPYIGGLYGIVTTGSQVLSVCEITT